MNYNTELFCNLLKEDKSFVYIKYGDGEYYACIENNGTNCDGEKYSMALGEKLKDSFIYFTKNNSYIGKWHNEKTSNFFSSLTKNIPNWCNYHSVILDKYNLNLPYLKNLFLEIKNSKRTKLAVINSLMIKIKPLLNIDHLVDINLHGWFNYYDFIKSQCINQLGSCKNPLILTAAGMASKVLIRELHELYPDGIFIDIGSCLDWLLCKKDSRGWASEFNYENVYKYFEELLPYDWNNEKYNNIYSIAKSEIGIHLH